MPRHCADVTASGIRSCARLRRRCPCSAHSSDTGIAAGFRRASTCPLPSRTRCVAVLDPVDDRRQQVERFGRKLAAWAMVLGWLVIAAYGGEVHPEVCVKRRPSLRALQVKHANRLCVPSSATSLGLFGALEP